MSSIQNLMPLITEPREDLAVEYKNWLDISKNEHKALIAKASIALVNHGGGFIVLGFADDVEGLKSHTRPTGASEITQDAINAIIRKYATPEFHCEVYAVTHPTSGVVHPVIAVPGTLTEPVMSKRDCLGVIACNKCYIRKPGPRSEEPLTGEEWRSLLSRCVRAGREDMLEAIRSIVSGRVDVQTVSPSEPEKLKVFCDSSRNRWEQLTVDLPKDDPVCFPHGYYEMGFSLVGAKPANGLADLQDRLRIAGSIKLTGWTPFLEMSTPQWSPYPFENYIEAWVGRPVPDRLKDAAHSNFWRVSPDGFLYSISGYDEDALESRSPGKFTDITIPVWRVAEAVLFASRFAKTFEYVDSIAIRCTYTGLNDRKLISVTGDRAIWGDDVCRSDEIALEIQVTPEQINDNLVEIIHQLLSPLYERFDFFRLSPVLVEQELERMVKNRY